MIFWFLFLFFFLILTYLEGYLVSGKKTFLMFGCLVLVFLSGFRGIEIGNDTAAYVNIFDSIKDNGIFFAFIARYEIGYIYLNKLFIALGMSVHQLFLFIAIIIIFPISNFIKKHSHYILLSLFLFIGLRFYFSSFNILRQHIALSFFLTGITYFKINRKNLVIAILLGSLFHYGCLILLVLPLVYKIKINNRLLLVLGVIGIFIFINFSAIFSFLLSKVGLYAHYQTSKFAVRDSYLASLMYTLMSLLVLLLVLRVGYLKKKTDIKSNIFVWMLIFSTGFNFIAIQASILDRFAGYFNIVLILLIPNSIYLIKNDPSKVIIKNVILLITIIFFVVVLVNRPEWNNVYPYKMSFNE